jgi:hypothetical protein
VDPGVDTPQRLNAPGGRDPDAEKAGWQENPGVIQGLADKRMPLPGAKQSFGAVMKLNQGTGQVTGTPGEYSFEPGSSGSADTALFVHPGGYEWPPSATPSVVRFFKAHPK